jgi:hypothetical protein
VAGEAARAEAVSRERGIAEPFGAEDEVLARLFRAALTPLRAL